MAVLRPVHRPRHHRRSLSARRPGRSRCAAQLPHPAGEPRVRLRRRAGRLALPLRARRPRPVAARRGRRRRAPQRRGRGAGRRPAQRQPPVHEPAPSRLPARPQPARRPTARRRRARGVGLRRGAVFAHLALPVGAPARLPPEPDRSRARRALARPRRRALPGRRRAVHPVRVRRRRIPLRPLADPPPLPDQRSAARPAAVPGPDRIRPGGPGDGGRLVAALRRPWAPGGAAGETDRRTSACVADQPARR